MKTSATRIAPQPAPDIIRLEMDGATASTLAVVLSSIGGVGPARERCTEILSGLHEIGISWEGGPVCAGTIHFGR